MYLITVAAASKTFISPLSVGCVSEEGDKMTFDSVEKTARWGVKIYLVS